MKRNAHTSSRRDRSKSRSCRVFLNGEDVSDHCYFGDDRRGIVRLYQLRNGRPFFDPRTNSVSREEKRGQVRFDRLGQKRAAA